jgi:hypothetical protein
LVDIAVIAVVPFEWDVTTPVAALIEATEGTLEAHTAAGTVDVPIVAPWPVRFTVVPVVVVPMATRFAV